MYYNRRCTPTPKFQPGDRVWLDSSDIHTDRPSAKLADHALGDATHDPLGHVSHAPRLYKAHEALRSATKYCKVLEVCLEALEAPRT
jgi:hypothetical protein